MIVLPLVLASLARAALASPADPAAMDLDRWDLVRVDEPDYPGAVATSASGSVLLAPPTDHAWRVEEVPWIDQLDADQVQDPSPATLPAETGLEGVGTWVAWDADAALQVSPWQAAGFDGTRPDGSPIKVAIFDVQWYGLSLAADELGDVQTHDCWAQRSCELPIDDLRPVFSWEVGSHGVACAQLIRDLAPGVELHLVRVNGPTTLENAVDWAVREHIDIVSMSMSFFNNSFYDGTGPISGLMKRLADGGLLMVTSAGNYAEQHWRGPFRDTDGDRIHEFFPDRRLLPIYMSAGANGPQVIWNDFDRCGHADLALTVYAQDGTVVGRSDDVQDGGQGCEPVERVRAWAETTDWYYLELSLSAGSPDVDIDVLSRGGLVYQGVAAGSVTDPGASAAVLTVGAVRADGYATNGPESFSSQGPTNGGLAKPDLAGPDGVTTSIYGPAGFYGTSAATPAVAATLAVLMSADPDIDAFEAARRLRGQTLDHAATWEVADPGVGAGPVRLAPPGTELGGHGCGGRALLLPLGLPAFLVRRRRGLAATLSSSAAARRSRVAAPPRPAQPPREP